MKKNKKEAKKGIWGKRIFIIVLLSFVVPLGFLLYRIFTAPTVASDNISTTIRVKSDYILMFIQCILGIFALILPSIISKKMKLRIPSNMYIPFMIFLYCAIFLGEVRNFYYNVPHWDTILHTFSGAMLGALGFSFVSLLNNQKRIQFKLTPFFISAFAFCFAVTLGALWEIYEFSFDGILGLNMQKFALEDGTLLVGREALSDTMKDIIVDCIGAGATSFIGYISLKYKKGWYEKLLIRKTK